MSQTSRFTKTLSTVPLPAKSAHCDSSKWSRKVIQGAREQKKVINSKLNPEIERLKSLQKPNNVFLSFPFPCVWKSQHLQCIVSVPPSEDPSVSAANPIESEEAIKIPSCHKKPLRRVDAGRLLADMKRIPALLFAQLQTGSVFALVSLSHSTGSDKKLPSRPGST